MSMVAAGQYGELVLFTHGQRTKLPGSGDTALPKLKLSGLIAEMVLLSSHLQKGCMTAAGQSSELVLLTRGQLAKLPGQGDATLPKGKPATSRTDRTASAVHASATYKRAAGGRSKDAAPAYRVVAASCSGFGSRALVGVGWPENHITEMWPWPSQPDGHRIVIRF